MKKNTSQNFSSIQQPVTTVDRPVSAQTSHHFLAFSPETNNACTSPNLEQVNDNVSSPKKMCASSDGLKLVSVGVRASTASPDPSSCYRRIPVPVDGSAPTTRGLLDPAPSASVYCDAKENDHQSRQVLQNKELSGIERLKRHREDVAGRTSVPEKWSQESLLKEWMDYSSFDELLAPIGLDSAREALIAEGRRAKSQRLRVESSC